MSNTIDVNQMILNLKGKLTAKEIVDISGLKTANIEELQASFLCIQALLNLHLEVCPEHHNHEQLFIKI